MMTALDDMANQREVVARLRAALDRADRVGSGPAAIAWGARVHAVAADWYAVAPPAREYLFTDTRTDEGALARRHRRHPHCQGRGRQVDDGCQLAVSVTTGTPWLGVFQPTMTGRVLLVLAEETPEEIQRRLHAIVAMTGRPPPRA